MTIHLHPTVNTPAKLTAVEAATGLRGAVRDGRAVLVPAREFGQVHVITDGRYQYRQRTLTLRPTHPQPTR